MIKLEASSGVSRAPTLLASHQASTHDDLVARWLRSGVFAAECHPDADLPLPARLVFFVWHTSQRSPAFAVGRGLPIEHRRLVAVGH